MNMRSIRNILTLIALLVFPTIDTVATEVGQERPFTEHGVVDAGLQSGVLIISDSTYYVTDQTKVHKPGGKSATLGDLKQGTKVGFNMYGTRAHRYLAEVWILPPGFDLKSLADE